MQSMATPTVPEITVPSLKVAGLGFLASTATLIGIMFAAGALS